jgi:hypothetical protein
VRGPCHRLRINGVSEPVTTELSVVVKTNSIPVDVEAPELGRRLQRQGFELAVYVNTGAVPAQVYSKTQHDGVLQVSVSPVIRGSGSMIEVMHQSSSDQTPGGAELQQLRHAVVQTARDLVRSLSGQSLS